MTVRDLPALNAALNATSAVLLVWGWTLVRRRRLVAHQRVMTAAFITSALFLVSYLTYHVNVGSVKYLGTGTARVVYFTVLSTHTVLAGIVAPLAITVFVLARRKRFAKHRRLARWTLPIWLYVSITGVVVYVMLYTIGPHAPVPG
jgi:putative membrane protein